MLQSEFKDLTGITVSAEEYGAIEAIYNESDLDKKVFCKEWVANDRMGQTKRMANIIQTLNERLFDRHKEIKGLHNELMELGKFMLAQSDKFGSPEMRQKAIEILGFKEYIRIKLAEEYNLWEDDKIDLLNLINDMEG